MHKHIFLVALTFAATSFAQPLPSYYTRNTFLMASPSAFGDGLVGFVNPASLAFINKMETRFHWTTEGTDATSFNDWGYFSGVRGLSLGMSRQNIGGVRVKDYRISTGFGSRGFALGFGYGWSKGDFDALGRERLLTSGAIIRPSRYLSLGLLGNFSLESKAREGVAEIGVRPFGSPRLTLFADGALQNDVQLSEAPWSAGAALQLVSGVNLVGRSFKGEAFTFGLALNFGRSEIAAQSHFDAEQNHAFNSYMLRLGSRQPSFADGLAKRDSRYLPLMLKGRVDYHKFIFGDEDTHRFLEILQSIRAAANDRSTGVIALNLSRAQLLPEHAWEIRAELQRAREAGKKIFVFIDNAEMTTYHLASVADKIFMDPEGTLMLEGYRLGRTYLKGTLAKLGLGFDEWRFFKYKSALESLSRENMSEADREQYQNFVDDWYELVRGEVSRSRKLTEQTFDQLIDNEVFFLSEQALAKGLVDSLARWSALNETIAKSTGHGMRAISARALQEEATSAMQWGERPKIAVVYALGECDLDTGIRARWLERVLLNLAKDRSVKAIVFRVDSPGGDGLASDLVAEALAACKAKKPVIVSQGQVAGSGGYWISMYGDQIIAGPNTITGSIGVIGGWVYDNGLGNKLGMTSDVVKRGAHADLGFGVRLPLLGVQVPSRNLTPEEREQVASFFQKFYDGFVAKVAKGRKLSIERVKEIAEGHFYSGLDGKTLGLVDDIGGLMTALAIAKQRAGFEADDDVELIEIPRNKGWFDFGSRLSPLPAQISEDAVLRYLKMMSARPGQPLPMLLPGTYPSLE
ncbi:MAG: signal peptide peptidase SppA [candidate division KSB1 bacterium]